MKAIDYLYAILVSLVILSLMCCLASCRTVSKSTSSSQASADTASVKKSSNGQKLQGDSSGFSSQQQGSKTETNTATGDQVTAKFGQDSSERIQPVTITFHSDGSATIDPGGRQLQEINYNKSRQAQTKDSSGTSSKQASKTGTLDSSWRNKSDSSGSRKVVIAETTSVKRSAPWQLYVAGAFVLGLMVLAAYFIFKK